MKAQPGEYLLWRLAILVSTSIVLLAPSSAAAETRSGAVNDPDDIVEPPSLTSPIPPKADISSVSVSYDTAGSYTFVVTFHHPVAKAPVGNVFFELESRMQLSDRSLHCGGGEQAGTEPLGARSSGFVDLDDGSARATISGFEGEITPAHSWDSSRTILTVTVTHPALANREFVCGDAHAFEERETDNVNDFTLAGFAPTVDADDAEFFSERAVQVRHAGAYRNLSIDCPEDAVPCTASWLLPDRFRYRGTLTAAAQSTTPEGYVPVLVSFAGLRIRVGCNLKERPSCKKPNSWVAEV